MSKKNRHSLRREEWEIKKIVDVDAVYLSLTITDCDNGKVRFFGQGVGRNLDEIPMAKDIRKFLESEKEIGYDDGWDDGWKEGELDIDKNDVIRLNMLIVSF